MQHKGEGMRIVVDKCHILWPYTYISKSTLDPKPCPSLLPPKPQTHFPFPLSSSLPNTSQYSLKTISPFFAHFTCLCIIHILLLFSLLQWQQQSLFLLLHLQKRPMFTHHSFLMYQLRFPRSAVSVLGLYQELIILKFVAL